MTVTRSNAISAAAVGLSGHRRRDHCRNPGGYKKHKAKMSSRKLDFHSLLLRCAYASTLGFLITSRPAAHELLPPALGGGMHRSVDEIGEAFSRTLTETFSPC